MEGGKMKIVWLHEIINPPMEQGREETSEHRDETQHGQKRTIPIKTIYPCEVGAQCKYKKDESPNPPKPGRIQRGWRWTKKNFFNAMLTLFTALYAIGFLSDVYISKRAYITPGTQDGKFVSFLPGDVGIDVLFRNAGQ